MNPAVHIKSLERANEELRAEVSALKSGNDALERQILELEKRIKRLKHDHDNNVRRNEDAYF